MLAGIADLRQILYPIHFKAIFCASLTAHVHQNDLRASIFEGSALFCNVGEGLPAECTSQMAQKDQEDRFFPGQLIEGLPVACPGTKGKTDNFRRDRPLS